MLLCKHVVYILTIRIVFHSGIALNPLNRVDNTFSDKMISDISNPLVEYSQIGAPSYNIPLCSLTQQGANILGKSSGWIKILWILELNCLDWYKDWLKLLVVESNLWTKHSSVRCQCLQRHLVFCMDLLSNSSCYFS